MIGIPDMYDMYAQYEQEQEKLRERLPICEECGHRIEDDYAYDLDGTVICEDCMGRKYKRVDELEWYR